ncbi:MAG: peptidase M15 [Ignavibacteria bacterium CG_4_9_14_3_um_filter_36_18]|nr:MAG: peptidase M15 [Ignavibacteria bacterium CG_4_9_14_3_um_filter_36_18]
MKKIILLLIITLSSIDAQSSNDELVPVRQLIPGIHLDLKYSTTDNFTSQKLYTVDEAYLTIGAIKKLKLVQDSLRNITIYDGLNYPQGIGLKIYDGYRPRAVQYLMWEIFPNPIYVADPTSGSVHNRGAAVDLTLIDLSTGLELPMPTEFDFFGPEAGHSYNNLPSNILANRALLKNMMINVGGFSIYEAEWWHYSITSAGLPLLDFQMK